MSPWRLFATFTLSLAMAAAAHAHAPETPETDPHAGESWFSSLKHNETEKELQTEQEQLDIQRTQATMSCAGPAEIAALDRQGEMLDVRKAIAIARKKRDQARKAGKTKLANKLEQKIHRAKLDLLEMATRTTTGGAEPE